MILVLAGTKDGRLFAKELSESGYPVLSSAVSPYGSSLLEEEGAGEVRYGPLDAAGLVALIQEQNITLVIDATHPYAAAVHQNSWQACKQLEIPWVRLERPGLSAKDWGDAKVLSVTDIAAAVKAAASIPGNIFLTTGSSSVGSFVDGLGPDRLVVRILPDPLALQQCAYLGISPERLIALQGPFSMELNRELFHHYKAAAVVSKESGKTGGLPEKIAAVAELNIPIIIVGRPPLPDGPVFSTNAALLEYVKNIIK